MLQNQQLYLGVDYHKNYSFLSLLDSGGKKIKQGRIDNHKEDLTDFLKYFNNQNIKSVMEAGRNWTVMYDWLEEQTGEVKLAHPLKVKVIAEAKIKTDKIDSEALANLLRVDLLPTAYVPSMEARDARQLLRQRIFFVRLQTMVKNRIVGLIDKHEECQTIKKTELFTQKGIQSLFAVSLPDKERKILDQDLLLLKDIKKRIEESNELIESLSQEKPDIARLRTLPGIGTFFATLIAFEVDNIDRFVSEKKFHAYIGLIPSTYSSGDKTFHGKITKQGNKWLRWAFIEAVWPAIQKDPEFRKYYQTIKDRKGANSAKVATARRLATIAFKILKEKREYRLPSYHLNGLVNN